MAAAQPVLVDASPYRENPSSFSKEKMCDLIHDLRQPLSSIDAIAYYLEMTLPGDQLDTLQYLRRLQQLVDQTSTILACAATDLRRPSGRADAA